jgi:ATP/maltotriose-dependent transcriptional regulator MalT
VLQGYLGVYRAQIHRLRNELTDALEHASEASENASRIGHREIRLLADLERTQILMERGEFKMAAEIAAAVWVEAAAQMINESAAHAIALVAEAHQRRGAVAEARLAVSKALSVLVDGTFPEVEWRAHFTAGKLQESLGATASADAHGDPVLRFLTVSRQYSG